MSDPLLYSISIPTVLLAIGLFFFIRASVKERTEQITLQCEQTEASLAAQLREYFTGRAYRVAKVEPETNQVIFEGKVRPSWFLAIFLTLLAAIGLLCVVPVLSILTPQLAGVSVGLVLLSPLAGVFYWKGADRLEQVSLKIEPVQKSNFQVLSQVTLRGHRDELANLQQTLPFKPIEE